MNELNTRLLEYLPDPNTVKGGIGGIVETMQAEAPLVTEEILRWNAVKSSIWCLFWTVISVVMVIAVFKYAIPQFYKWAKDDKDDDVGAILFACSVTVCVSLTPIIGIIVNLTWLKIWLAPRLFLIEYISNLMT